MKKKLIFCFMAVLILLTACKGSTLASAFNKDDVKASAQALIQEFNIKNYEAIIEQGSDLMKSSLTLEQWQETVDPYVDKAGAFKTIEKEVVAGQQDSNKKDYAIYVAVAEYENSKIQFTITFNTDMKVEQFLIQ